MKTHILGFPRIGQDRELKKALESYWRGDSHIGELELCGRRLRQHHWFQQADAGLDFVTVGDFAYYDQMLNTSALVGAVPKRFGIQQGDISLDTQFLMARGRAPGHADVPAQEMTKWFDTNYHYLVPELSAEQEFSLSSQQLFNEIAEAQALSLPVKAVLIGPVTYLWLSKCAGEPFDKLSLLERLLPVYAQILQKLVDLDVTWVQIDEPVLSLDLPQAWQGALELTYHRLQRRDINLLVATYFSPLAENLWLASHLPVAGLHIDGVRAAHEVQAVVDQLPEYKVLSLGIINGRNIWRSDLNALLEIIQPVHQRLKHRLWLSCSCSLLHVPVDVKREDSLPEGLQHWLAFATQKLDELTILKQALLTPNDTRVQSALQAAAYSAQQRKTDTRWRNDQVRNEVEQLSHADAQRKSEFTQREAAQAIALNLPLLPTTTIGSFPQTTAIRRARADFKAGHLSQADYTKAMEAEITTAISEQEALGIDVLVHGEAERNDMVEYFGEQLEGFVFTRFGWVQSYGSRCVKPPIIVGDVSRPHPMTVAWARYAQSLTNKPVKGMLTGPVTLLCWSFVRDDIPRSEVALQLALAVRKEVVDLEQAGIGIIQIDEPAFREGLPLRRSEQNAYWDWAVRAFRISASGVTDQTQIHTHMCYSEFNDCINHIAAMDADVITIETARSGMALLQAFEDFDYPNGIGPGVYDIHSPRVPETEAMAHLLALAARRIPLQRLWVNPDCGLKTRQWPEVRAALTHMVQATQQLRQQLSPQLQASG
jgi:5-methyltetrahydropteroyltriglutamate--homocysteine methyltransferase